MQSEIRARESMNLRECFEEVFASYWQEEQPRQELESLVPHIAAAMLALPSAKDPDIGDVVVEGSRPIGQRPSIPWFAIRHPKLAKSVQEGVFVAFLFRTDPEWVYLALLQGYGSVEEDHGNRGQQVLRDRREGILHRLVYDRPPFVPGLQGLGDGKKVDWYADATIVSSQYQRSDLDNEKLMGDLDSMLGSYLHLLSTDEEDD